MDDWLRRFREALAPLGIQSVGLSEQGDTTQVEVLWGGGSLYRLSVSSRGVEELLPLLSLRGDRIGAIVRPLVVEMLSRPRGRSGLGGAKASVLG